MRHDFDRLLEPVQLGTATVAREVGNERPQVHRLNIEALQGAQHFANPLPIHLLSKNHSTHIKHRRSAISLTTL